MPDTRELLNQRGWDLLRQMRMKLHEEDLITDEEYALLAVDHPAVKRLENYDVLRQQFESLRAEKAAIGSSIYEIHSMMVPDPLQADNARTFSEALHELGVAAVGVVALRAQLAAEKQRADALEADKERLMKATEGYIGVLMHSGNCKYDGDDKRLCNCGLQAAIDALDAARKPVPPVSEADELCDLCGTEHGDCVMAPNGKLVCPVCISEVLDAWRKPVPQEPKA